MADAACVARPPTNHCINDGSYEICDFVRLAKELKKTSHCEHCCDA